MTYDGSDRKQVRMMEKEAKLAEANRLAYVRRIMSDAAGRKWMHDLLVKCHIWNTPMVFGQPDATTFKLGEQNLGLQIFADVVNTASQEYVLMMQEATIKEQVHERRYSDDRTGTGEYPGGSDAGRDVEGPVSEYDPFDARTEDA